MPLFNLTIDRSSSAVVVRAEDEDDANEKGFAIYMEKMKEDFTSWVAEIEEVGEE